MCKINYFERAIRAPGMWLMCEQNGHSKYLHRKHRARGHIPHVPHIPHIPHIPHTHTHTHAIQHHCVDFTFVRQRFWFVVSKCRHAFTLQPRVCVFTCGLGFSAFLFLSHHNGGAKSSLCIIVQEQGRNQTLCMSRAGWGMFLSAASLLLFPDKA